MPKKKQEFLSTLRILNNETGVLKENIIEGAKEEDTEHLLKKP